MIYSIILTVEDINFEERIMKRLKRFWQGAILILLLALFLPCVNIATLSNAECIAIILFGINIGLEALELRPDEK